MKRKTAVKAVFMIIILVAVSWGTAQIPQLINYQGFLTDGGGNPITGSRSIEFRIYNSATGNVLLWNETQSVTVLDGIFSILLGSVNPIPYTLFDGSDRYLALKVGSDSEMTPRKRLVSVGYSYRANTADSLDGKVAGDFVETGDLPDIVSSIDGVTNDGGDVDLVEGSNITITPDDGANTITIAAAGGGSGDITSVTAGTGLTGGGSSGDVSLSVAMPLELSSTTTYPMIKGSYSLSLSHGYIGSIGGYAPNGILAGVYGQEYSIGGEMEGALGYNGGVYGEYSGIGGETYGKIGSTHGVFGMEETSENYGYLGGLNYGAYGESGTGNNLGYFGGSSYGCYGEYDNRSYGYLGGYYYGVYAEHDNSGNYGYIAGSNYSVMGYHKNSTNWAGLGSSSYAGYFDGNVNVVGELYKACGSLMIDHPLDPDNKYLCHSSVESPDMMNVYNGNVILDGNGEARVILPNYFQALNRDFRYQLTAIGAPGPNLYIAEEISGNQFVIAGGESGMKVSWQVTGIRKDAWAEANRIQVEVVKEGKERGTYLFPELIGRPASSRIGYQELQRNIVTHQQILEEKQKIKKGQSQVREDYEQLKERRSSENQQK